jgi:capsular polysaccharide biosynthesis protein
MEKIVYLPHAGISHFGHLLTECAAYLGPLLEHPEGLDGIGDLGAVLVVSPRSILSSARVAELLGVPVNRVITTTSLVNPVKCIKAVVPLPSMMNRHSVATRHFRHVRKLLERLHGCGDQLADLGTKGDQGEKLYLSRSRLPSAARHAIAEEELESNLSEMGWRIVFPEQLSVRSQLDCLVAARTVAGCLGSALHLLMAFGEHVGNRRLITLGPTADQSNPNVFLQAKRQQLPLRHIVCLKRKSAECQDLQFLLPPAQVADRLDSLATEWN